jgi:hypothetical protein
MFVAQTFKEAIGIHAKVTKPLGNKAINARDINEKS